MIATEEESLKNRIAPLEKILEKPRMEKRSLLENTAGREVNQWQKGREVFAMAKR